MQQTPTIDEILQKLREQSREYDTTPRKGRRFPPGVKKSVVAASAAGVTVEQILQATDISKATILRWTQKPCKRKRNNVKRFERLEVVPSHDSKPDGRSASIAMGEFIFPTGIRLKMHLSAVSAELLSRIGVGL